MKPNTSRWGDNNSYDFFDSLPIEGLAWECLRRSDSYQRLYLALVRSGTETKPFPAEVQRRWGLRFRGPSRPVRIDARRFMVTSCRSCRARPRPVAGLPVVRPFQGACRGRPWSRQSARFACRP
ncbi:DUF6499 domain-containing protein [Mesorhizobium sp.]|uniref:transcriptional regulator domain-containing protein n=1 Tax=Mesorhizobium sp. TaxID=1871066 RepID=UPI0025D390C4|nr:DUF6499 domain-containing protein [Mesorhizobium sp.]